MPDKYGREELATINREVLVSRYDSFNVGRANCLTTRAGKTYIRIKLAKGKRLHMIDDKCQIDIYESDGPSDYEVVLRIPKEEE